MPEVKEGCAKLIVNISLAVVNVSVVQKHGVKVRHFEQFGGPSA